ncbi:MAG: TrgA family protein [Arenibacterium sp.]
MPDAARLVASLSLMLIAFILTGQIIPLFDEGTDFGYFLWVNLAVGFFSGWIVMGKRAGRGITAAVNNGVTGVVAMLFWGLFIQGTNEMVRLAMRNRYDGPFEAVLALFEEAAE